MSSISHLLRSADEHSKIIRNFRGSIRAEQTALSLLEEELIRRICEECPEADAYVPHSTNWYRVLVKRAQEMATEMLGDAKTQAEGRTLKGYVTEWTHRFCDWSPEIDPSDTRMGNIGPIEKINALLDEKGYGDVREIAQVLKAEGDCYHIVGELTPDSELFAIAAYIVRNNWKKLGISDGEWDDDHKPTDFEILCEEKSKMSK